MKLSTELGFDGEAAFKKATYYAEKYGTGRNSFEIIYAFKGGAFWQHLQDSAALSAMNSLATKYRNNCDMLMQHRGVFKDENAKLRAENAILREGLKEIKDRVDLEDMNFDICQEALAAADKARGAE